MPTDRDFVRYLVVGVVQHVLFFARKWADATWLLLRGWHFVFSALRIIDFDVHVLLLLFSDDRFALCVGPHRFLSVIKEAVDALVNRVGREGSFVKIAATCFGVALQLRGGPLWLFGQLGRFFDLLRLRKVAMAGRELAANGLFAGRFQYVDIVQFS